MLEECLSHPAWRKPLATLHPDIRREHHPPALRGCELRPPRCPQRVPRLRLRIRTLEVGQSLQISGLPARARRRSLRRECHRIQSPASLPNRFLEPLDGLRGDCLLAGDLRFGRHISLRCLLCQLLLGRSRLFRRQVFLRRLFYRLLLITGSTLGLRRRLLGFLFGSHKRSLPLAHAQRNRNRGLLRGLPRWERGLAVTFTTEKVGVQRNESSWLP